MQEDQNTTGKLQSNDNTATDSQVPQPGAVVGPPSLEPSQPENSAAQDAGPTPTIQMTRRADPSEITWTASEFVDHAKSVDWYLALAVVAVLAAIGSFLLVHDITLVIVIAVVALAFGYYGTRRPRQLEYRLNNTGLYIGEKFLPFRNFRSFALEDEGAFSSLALLPLKRFGLLISIYYDPKDEDPILDLISQHLPLENRGRDPVDNFLRRIRF